MQIKELLEVCDKALGEISVSGNDVFTMVKARQYLKAAYDIVLKENENETTIPEQHE